MQENAVQAVGTSQACKGDYSDGNAPMVMLGIAGSGVAIKMAARMALGGWRQSQMTVIVHEAIDDLCQ